MVTGVEFHQRGQKKIATRMMLPFHLFWEVLSSLEGHGYRPLHTPAEAVVLGQPERNVPPLDDAFVLLELRDDGARELVGHEVRDILLPCTSVQAHDADESHTRVHSRRRFRETDRALVHRKRWSDPLFLLLLLAYMIDVTNMKR